MYSPITLARKYLQYKLNAENGKGHGVHSPFVFDFIANILDNDSEFYCYKTIENIRSTLKRNKTLLTIEDFGAGSRVNSNRQRSIKSIAYTALKPKKYSRLMFRMINYYQPQTIVELGTSLGITTAYLASGNHNAEVITMEGAASVAAVALENFKQLGINNVKLVQGNFDNTLPVLLETVRSIDFSFIDGNHCYQPTVNYFNLLLQKSHDNTILIFDDIHWSKEMEQAWQYAKEHPRVTVSIDLFFIGIVFLKPEFKVKQHFVINF